MKLISIMLVLFSFAIASAAENLNHIGCVYYYDQEGWHPWQIFSSKDSYSLSVGQSKFLTGMWTSEKPNLPNFAVCTSMVGTGSNDAVIIINHVYEAKAFNALDGNELCSVTGDEVKIVSKTPQLINRGAFSILETEWLPPYALKIQIREYFPKLDELENLKDIAVQKCDELTPGKSLEN